MFFGSFLGSDYSYGTSFCVQQLSHEATRAAGSLGKRPNSTASQVVGTPPPLASYERITRTCYRR